MLLLIIAPFELSIHFSYSASMYLGNVFLHGGLAPVLPDILSVSALKLFTPPVNRTDHRYDLATGDILVRSAMSQKANAMLARFKVNNIAYS